MLKLNLDTFEHIKVLILKVESLYKLKVRMIRTDNGTLFKNNQMLLFCNKKGIQQQFSHVYTPQSNGVAERKNMTLIKTARTMLADSCLPIIFGGEAVSTACYVMNSVLVVKRHGKTSYELLHKRKPNIKYLEPFGAPCTILVRDTGGKFNSKAISGIFLGYGNPKKRVYNTESKCVEERFEVDIQCNALAHISKGFAWPFEYDKLFDSFNLPPDVTDNEVLTQMLYDVQNSTENVISIPSQTQNQIQNPNVEVVYETDEDSDSEEDEGANRTRLTEEHMNPLYNQPPTVTRAEPPTEVGRVRRSNRVIMPPKRLDDYYMDTRGIPHIGIPHAKSNKASTSEVPSTSDVPELEAIRIFLAFASFMGFKVYQMDVKSAFLYGEMNEKVYVEQHLVSKILISHKRFIDLKRHFMVLTKLLEHGMPRCPTICLRTVSERSTDQGLVDEFEKNKYVADILKRFQVEAERPAKTPLSVNHGISPDSYSNSDFGGCKKDFKSTSGGCQFLGSKLVTWQCKKQTAVAQSICKAEYIAAASYTSQIKSKSH
ncbi:uncharacterized protein [Rutidosis leptorrhynchoides]|uniref:uncharacterized protein n=1 Tax=Rutidosis leptorrhynchoides TaxID=125765 RepID=UPI003A9A342C